MSNMIRCDKHGTDTVSFSRMSEAMFLGRDSLHGSRLPFWMSVFLALTIMLGSAIAGDYGEDGGYLKATAYHIPPETTSEESGYFSIIEGLDGKLYIGTAKYGSNAYLLAFDPEDASFRVVIDAHAELGYAAEGYAAQSKFHTRNNVGASGRIYAGTKQGYPRDGESRTDYPGGHPMVYDPATDTTRVYNIPVPHHGIADIRPDEARGVAYVSTAADTRPRDSSHFLVLDLETGEYTDLGDLEHMYAFIVVDDRHRAYHPIAGGDIARYDPENGRLDRLTQRIDDAPPPAESRLADEHGHLINWDISPDRKTLYAVPMNGNQLYRYDLTSDGMTIEGESLGPLLSAASATDCRAMCVGADGVVWMAVRGTFADGRRVHLVRFDPRRDTAPVDRGSMAVRNPDYTVFNADD